MNISTLRVAFYYKQYFHAAKTVSTALCNRNRPQRITHYQECDMWQTKRPLATPLATCHTDITPLIICKLRARSIASCIVSSVKRSVIKRAASISFEAIR
ncbi:MAG: hypothetical protein ACOX2E_07495 [Syntrophaceticus sp.]